MRIVKRIFWLLLLVGAVAGALYYATRPKPIEVRTGKLDRGLIEKTVVNTRAGTVKACRRAQLSPAMGGQIAEWPVREGMGVKQGDVLLTLWNHDLTAQVELAESEEKTAQARADAACLQADIAARQAERYKTLEKQGATSEEKLDTLQTESHVRRADCLAARASLKVSGDRLALARANLDRSLLYAPFDGIIADLNGELGEFVTPSPIGIQTPPTVDLIDTSCFYVSAPIDEVDAGVIRTGMEARISLDAYRDRTYAGRVKRIADFVLDLEKQARTVEIEVEFSDPSQTVGLLPGYSADAEVIVETKNDVLRIPTEAVLEDGTVYVFDPAAQMIHRISVETGLSNWDFTEITGGLNEGTVVVVSVDRPGLKDGAFVKIAEAGDE